MKKDFSTFSVIPTEVMINKEISSTAKVVYGIISSLTNEKGYCWASNRYLGELMSLSEGQISLIINELVKQRLIISDIEANYKRKLRLVIKIVGYAKTSRGVVKNNEGGVTKNKEGVNDKSLHNNIIEQDKDNSIIDIAEASSAEVIPDLLNDNKKHIQVIGLFALAKKVNFKSKKHQQDFIKRNLRAAKLLDSYNSDKIKEVMRYLISNTDFKWTLETVSKYVDEDLISISNKHNIVVI